MKQIIFCAIMLVCCNIAFSQNDETANILAIQKSVADAFTKHNMPYITSAFADDATIVTPNGELITKQQLIQNMPNINSVVLSDLKVKIRGGGIYAVVTGIQTETGKNDSGVYTGKSRFTDVLEKIKGKWIITASHATSVEE